LRGIIEKLPYLQDLGVDILWICPFYQSPMFDNGYDISDYYHVDSQFGTDEDALELIQAADARGIRIMLDLVINHTSHEHEWFRKAWADPTGEYGQYYYIREGKDGGPPTNWRSLFGGNAWEPIRDTGLYYLHVFGKEQPDLNWEIQSSAKNSTKWSTGGSTKASPGSEWMRSLSSRKTWTSRCLNPTSRTAWP